MANLKGRQERMFGPASLTQGKIYQCPHKLQSFSPTNILFRTKHYFFTFTSCISHPEHSSSLHPASDRDPTMAQSRDNQFNPSSPHSSSGGADSFKGTPDTRLTAFSPDESSTRSSKLFKNFARSASATPPVRLPVNSYRGTVSHLDKDPFVSPVHGTRLSPTASAFRPVVNLVGFSFPHDAGPIANALSTDLGLSHHLDVSSSVPLSVSEVDSCMVVGTFCPLFVLNMRIANTTSGFSKEKSPTPWE